MKKKKKKLVLSLLSALPAVEVERIKTELVVPTPSRKHRTNTEREREKMGRCRADGLQRSVVCPAWCLVHLQHITHYMLQASV